MTVILMYRHLWKLTAKQRLFWHSITKTLQNGSRQSRTDRNLPRNSTDRPKNKVCETGSDSFRKRANRTLSRSRERNPKTGTDNHDIRNRHRRATCLAVLHIFWQKNTLQDFFVLQGVAFILPCFLQTYFLSLELVQLCLIQQLHPPNWSLSIHQI